MLRHGPRPPGSAALAAVRADLGRALVGCGWEWAEQRFVAPTPAGEREFVNLLARFSGSNGEGADWQRPVAGLVAAHVDSKWHQEIHFLGADDALSACAGLVELAALAAVDPSLAADQIELVFFDGEEALGPEMNARDGLYGSKYYASRWRGGGRGALPQWAVVLDMIGHRELQVRIPSDSPRPLREALFASAAAEGAAERFGMAAIPILDDHVPLQLLGIPALDVIGDFQNFPWWHQESDGLENLSAESLEISLRVVRGLLRRLLGT